MPGEELKQFFALAEIRFGSLSVGNVLDGAAHGHGFACFIALEASHAMDPAGHAIVLAHDPVFAVKKLVPAERDLDAEYTAMSSRPSGWREERDPAVDRAFKLGPDSENFIENIGGSPELGLQIEYVTAKTGDALGFLQRACQVAEGAIGLPHVVAAGGFP